MAHILLHIGTPKTGTTSLQNRLAGLTTELRDLGILYPQAGRGAAAGPAHHLLSWSITGKHGYTDDSCWHALHEELEATAARLAVVSSEGFAEFTTDQVARVADRLRGHEVRVVVYLRNQRDFMVSYFKQYVKSTRRRYRHSLRRFLDENIHRCDYPALIERWSTAFSPQRVEFRLYDKVKNSPGIERDFLNLIGTPCVAMGGELPAMASNVSPSDDGTRLLRVLNSVESSLPGVRVVEGLCFRARRKLMRREARTERYSAVLARLLTPPLSTTDDLDFLRRTTQVFNERLFSMLEDPLDRKLFDF